MKGLTQKQKEILDYITSYIDLNRFSPSYREIMTNFGMTSPGTVYKHIQVLKRKGALINEPKCGRSLSPANGHQKAVVTGEITLPLIGYISQGNPIEMLLRSQSISIPSSMVPSPDTTYILRAQGMQLQEELILEGDFLIVETRQDIHPGETIIGLVNEHDTIVKRYYPEGQYIRLESQDSNQPPLILRTDHIIIQGVLIGLLRNYTM